MNFRPCPGKRGLDEMTIKLDDGYTVAISDSGSLTFEFKGKKSTPTHVTHFKEVPADCPAAKFLRDKGLSLDDYMLAEVSKTLVRKAGGIGEAIKEAAARCRKESEDREAQFKAKRDAEIAAERAQCGLSNPVNVFVHSYDGYPMHIKHGGKELKPRDWSVIKGNQFSFIESAVLAELIEAHDAAEAAKRQAVADRDAAAKSAFQSRLVEAQTLGKPVALESWMTDRCMKRHRDCSFDSATRWVNPDGTEKVTYTCCY